MNFIWILTNNVQKCIKQVKFLNLKFQVVIFFLTTSSIFCLAQNKKEQIEQLNMRVDSCKTVIELQKSNNINLKDENNNLLSKLTKTEKTLDSVEKLLIEKQNQVLRLGNENQKLKQTLDSIYKANEMIYKIDGVKLFELEGLKWIKIEAKQIFENKIALKFNLDSDESCACTESVTYIFRINGSEANLISIQDEEASISNVDEIKERLKELKFTFHQTSEYLDTILVENIMSGECCEITEGKYLIRN